MITVPNGTRGTEDPDDCRSDNRISRLNPVYSHLQMFIGATRESPLLDLVSVPIWL